MTAGILPPVTNHLVANFNLPKFRVKNLLTDFNFVPLILPTM